MASIAEEGKNNDFEVVETDPSGKYVRFNKILGEGATKKVYLGYDGFNGIEIAWSQTQVTEAIAKNEVFLTSLCAEAILLKKLDHENIMRCYRSWVDEDNKIINMITEYFNSGNLVEYIKKNNLLVKTKTIKNWCRQILHGLHYLHCRSHPIVHCDVKCQNILIDGYTGKVKLGDFGLVTSLEQKIKTYAGTPEFMAPEVFGLNYDQLVDIYSFGMSVLQMVTRESPYAECCDNDQIYTKIKCGEMPDALSKVTDPEVKEFIEKCLAPTFARPSAVDLLNDPFLATSVSSTLAASSCLTPRETVRDQVRLCEEPPALSIQKDPEINEFIQKFRAPASDIPTAVDLLNEPFHALSVSNTSTPCRSPSLRESVADEEDRLLRKKFELQGSMNDDNASISMNLTTKIEFVYLVGTDTIESVMKKLAEEHGMSTGDVKLVTEQMENLITGLYSPQEVQREQDISSEQDQECSQNNQDKEQEHGESETEVNRQQEIQEQEGEDRN